MQAPLMSRASLVAMLLAAVGVAAALVVNGGSMFSPGDLHAGRPPVAPLGGVRSHADLATQCGACHAPPFRAPTMQARCLACHTDIQRSLADASSLHGALPDGRRCMACHTDHVGAAGDLTRFDGLGAIHSAFGFPLDGAHTRVACRDCHTPTPGALATGRAYPTAPKTCVGCHKKDDTHRGSLGANCASCHTTSTWKGATFAHTVFPLDHGEGGRIACATCHENTANYKQYTCYNCHEHSRERVAAQHRGEVRGGNLDQCLECHRGGRGEGREHEGGDREH